MAAVPFHAYPHKVALLQRAPELAAAVLQRSARDGKQWDQRLDMGAALAVFEQLAEADMPGLRAAVLNCSHLLVYSLGGFWFDPSKLWVIEQFFIRIGRGPAILAMNDIDTLARDAGAKGVIMATSLAANDAALGRLYARHGYSPQSSQHFKEL